MAQQFGHYNRELVATSSLFFVPLYALHTNHIYVPWILKDMIIVQGVVSIAFWWSPVKGSPIHTVDKVLARISICSVIGYKMYTYPSISFTINIMVMFLFFKISNHFSRSEWCSKAHIINHGLAHLFAYNAIYLAFQQNHLQNDQLI
jgi:hypothetical protein